MFEPFFVCRWAYNYWWWWSCWLGGGGEGWFAGLSGSLRYAALAFLGLLFGKLGSCSISICRSLKRTRDLVDLQAKHQAIFTGLSMCLFVVWRNQSCLPHTGLKKQKLKTPLASNFQMYPSLKNSEEFVCI